MLSKPPYMPLLVSLAVCSSLFVSAAVADELCVPPNKMFDARPHFNKALAAEKAGRYEEALRAVKPVEDDCATGVSSDDYLTLHIRLYHALGKKAEQRRQYKEALEWYDKERLIAPSQRSPDIDRVMMSWVRSAPDDHNVLYKAYHYFLDAEGTQGSNTLELHRIGNQRADDLLAKELQLFKPSRPTLGELTKARDWLQAIDATYSRVTERALSRGDAFAISEAPGPLELAMEYYQWAEHTKKQQALQQRAAALGESAARRGEGKLAARFYRLAGRDDQAEKAELADKAKEQKTEATRRQNFDSEQKKLEKELGF